MTFEPQGIYKNGFVFDHSKVWLLVLKGPDARDFLNRLSTVQFEKTKKSVAGAFLNGQAKVISTFTGWFVEDDIYLLIDRSALSETKAYLEKMHFAEDFTFDEKELYCIETRGEQTLESSQKVEAYNWGLPGVFHFFQEKVQCLSIDRTQYDSVKAFYGVPKMGVDIGSEHILIEGPFEDFIDRNKGCYPGQEVIEKIYTYGRVARKIKKISFQNANSDFSEDLKHELTNSLPMELIVDDKNIGTLTSVFFDPTAFGLATIKRSFYEKNSALSFDFKGQNLTARFD